VSKKKNLTHNIYVSPFFVLMHSKQRAF